jgi:hypothetical protein
MTKPLAVGEIKPLDSEQEVGGKDQVTPTLGDGDDGDGDLDLEVVPEKEPLCSWSDDPDEHRRTFIFDRMNDAQIDGKILVENMQMVAEWLKTGTVPQPTKKGR